MKNKFRSSSRQRLLSVLREKFPSSFSRRYLKKAIDRGLCRVNGEVERFSTRFVDEKDQIELENSWSEILEKKRVSCQILYEDEEILAIQKPPFLACEEEKIREYVLQKCFLCHRLDKETSGALLLAKTSEMKKNLIALFAARKIQKSYLAIVSGRVQAQQGSQESFLEKKTFFQGQTLWGSAKQGLYAHTDWKCIRQEKDFSILLCRPHTGRTHQIRIHLKEMGHPILGDPLYGKRSRAPFFVERLLLHSLRMEFLLPNSQSSLNIFAPFPEAFSKILKEEELL